MSDFYLSRINQRYDPASTMRDPFTSHSFGLKHGYKMEDHALETYFEAVEMQHVPLTKMRMVPL